MADLWIFTTEARANAANTLCAGRLDKDRDAEGDVAPVQITKVWSRVYQTNDNLWAIQIMDGAPVKNVLREGTFEDDLPPPPESP